MAGLSVFSGFDVHSPHVCNRKPLTRISRQSVPLLGTSSAWAAGHIPHCFCEAVAHRRTISPRVGKCGLIGFCCGKPSVAFRSAKAALNPRCFRGAKGDNPANLLFPQQKLIDTRTGDRQNVRVRNVVLPTILACLFLAPLAARATEPPALTEPAGDEAPLRFAFITCCKDSPFYDPVKKGMRDAAKKMNVRCDWLGTEGVDIAAQAALVRRAVADGYNGIALSIIDPKAFDAVVAEAIKRGVPVVAFNVDDNATPNARLSGVCQRFAAAGRALAGRVAADIPNGAHVLAMLHDRGISALDERLQGMQQSLRGKDLRWTVVVTGVDAAKADKLITDALRQDPQIRVVLGTGQADTEAAGRVIEKQYADRGCCVAGFDLSPEILRLVKAGRIRCTVDQQPYMQGFYPVVQLAHYLRYGIHPADIDAGATIVDRANVDRVIELAKKKYR
jgi:simple sugar transport system substrate-binding protein